MSLRAAGGPGYSHRSVSCRGLIRCGRGKEKATCGGSFSLGALRLSRCGTRDRHRPCHSQT